MIAQVTSDFGEVGPAIAWVGALAVAFGPGAMGITKAVDFVRSFDKGDTWPKYVWLLVAWGIALAVCFGFQVNIVGGFFKELPAFQGSDLLDGWGGYLASAIGLAGASSYWHESMSAKSSVQKLNLSEAKDEGL